MKEFKIESKGSTIGLIIKLLGFSFLAIKLFNIIENFIGQKPIVNVYLILIVLIYLIYEYKTDKTVLIIHNKKLIIDSKIGFPKKIKRQEFDLIDIEKIKLIQSHNVVYGKKAIELIDSSNNIQSTAINLRYYQLVKLQTYLKEHLKIKTSLIG